MELNNLKSSLINIDCYISSSHVLKPCYKAILRCIPFLNSDFELSYSICKDCGLIIQTPRLPPDIMNNYYVSYSNYENPISHGRPSDTEVRSVERQVILIKKHKIKIGNALDIGCSTGFFLNTIREEGFSVLGIDPSPHCSAVAHELYDIKVITDVVENVPIKNYGPFQLVTLRHVLEHTQNPFSVLRKIWEVITDNGYILVEVPIFDHTHKLPFGYFTFEHLTYFTEKSLKRLLNKAGFNILDTIITITMQDNSLEYPVITVIGQKSNLQEVFLSNYEIDSELIEKDIYIYVQKEQRELERIRNVLKPFIDESINKKTKIILWGAGIHTSRLLGETDLLSTRLIGVFDNDFKKEGINICGIPILGPEQIYRTNLKFDRLILSSHCSEDEMYNQAITMGIPKDIIVRLYKTI